MSILDKITKKIPKYNPDIKAFAPENRSFLMFTTISVVLGASLLAIWLSSGDEVTKKLVALDSIDVAAKNTSVDSEVSPLYKESIKEINKQSYSKASKEVSGASMPIIYHDKPDTQYTSIEGCGCTFDENAKQALLEELRRLGVTGINKKDGLRLGNSDIYVQGDGTLIDESGKPLLWNGEKVRTDDKGVVLLSQTSMPIATSDGQNIYLSNEGKFYNEATAVVRLMGRLLTDDGVIILGTGIKANRPGGMEQVSNTDVYITSESQLATMDARPVYHSSKFAFKDLENRLHNHYGDDITWEEKSVFQQLSGSLTDRANTQFHRIGLLISHGGILIDNNSMLTEDLNDIKRFGDSDLFVNNSDYLVDSYGEMATYLDYFIRVGVNNSLISEIGPVVNSSNSEVFLRETGRFYADRPVYLTGTIKDSLGIAFDRFGHSITRRGKLSQLGGSVIWHTPDRYLATQDGQPVQYNNIDIFQDITRFKVINGVDAYGIKTFKNKIVKDLLGKEVYLNSDGHLVYENGLSVSESGILTTSKGVMITSNGGLIVGGTELTPVVDEFGNQVFLNGKKVFKGLDGRLYDEEGIALTSADGRALSLSASGVLTDSEGNIVPSSILSTLEPISNNEAFSTDASGILLNKDGKPTYYKGKKVYQGSDGRLYDEDGKVIKGKNGLPLSLNGKGVIIDSNGKPAIVDDFSTENNIVSLEPIGNGGFTAAENGEVLDENGNSIYYQGKKVFRGKDGLLYDVNGAPLVGDNGRTLSLKNGQIVDSNGKPVEMEGFEASVKALAFEDIKTNGEFSVDPSGQILDKNGNGIYFKGKKVRVGADGHLYDEDGVKLVGANGKPLSYKDGAIVDSNGNLASIDSFKVGKPQVSMKPVTKNEGFTVGKSGQVLDANGNALYHDGKKVYQGENGNLYDANGNIIKDDNGQPLRLNSRGEIVTPNGTKADTTAFEVAIPSNKLRPFGNEIFTTDTDESLLDAGGKHVYYQGKKVKVGADGRLYDESGKLLTNENGQPLKLNASGEIVDPSGNPASLNGFQVKDTSDSFKSLGNTGFIKSADGSLLNANGESVYYQGKKVKVGADGRLYDESGKLLTNENGQPLKLNSAGEIVDPSGNSASLNGFQVKDTSDSFKSLGNTGFIKSADGSLLNANGESVYYQGKKVKVGADGRLYDESGKLLTNENGQPLKLNATGEIVDPAGHPASLDGFQVSDATGTLKQLGNTGFTKSADGSLLNANGESVYYQGKKVKVGADGRLYDESGKLLTNDNGQPLKLNAAGEIVDPSGNPASLNGFQVKDTSDSFKPLGNTGFTRTADGSLLNANGESVYYQGKKVKVGADGRLYDESGKLLTNENGQPLKLNAAGEIVDPAGNPASLNGFQVSDANGTLMPLGNTGFTRSADGSLLNANGESVYYQGKKVKVGADGRLYDESGKLLTNENGQPLKLNPAGEIVDPSGNPASLNGFQVKDTSDSFKSLGNTGFTRTADGSLLNANGENVYYQGKKVKVGADGRLYDESGKLLTNENGQPLKLNAAGEIVDPAGNPASLNGFQVKDTSDSFKSLGNTGFIKSADGSLLNANGESVYYQGKKVKVGADGRLYDESGKLLTNENGQPLKLNPAGEIVDPSGVPVPLNEFQISDSNGSFKSVGNTGFTKSADGSLLNANGESVYYQGKKVKVGADGRLYDESGKLLTNENGQPLKLNSSGEIVDQSGKAVSLRGFKTGQLSNSHIPVNNSGFIKSADGSVLNANGNPLYYKGKKVRVGADGKLYDQDGVVITDASGQPLKLNSEGVIVDSVGNPISMEEFRVAKSSNGKRFTTQSGNTLSQLGDTGIYTTDDGLLLDKNGKPITYKGKRVRRGKDGKLYDGNGQVILDELGRPLYMDDDGQVVDVNGNKAKGVHFQNGDGQYLANSEGTPKVRRLGESDMYITREGLVTDDQGRPILHNGKPVKIGAGGKLMTVDGDFITDGNGNAVMLTNDGELKNREQQPSKGGVLHDADGVTLDAKGLRVTNGGKLTDLGNGLFRTEEGLLVDRMGKPILIDGKQAFVNADGEIIDANGRSVRHLGKRLYLSSNGTLADGQGNQITSEGQSVSLTGKGLTRQDGTLITRPDTDQDVELEPNQALRAELAKAQSDSQASTTTPSEPVSNEITSMANEEELAEAKFGLAKVLDIKDLTDKEIIRLNERYRSIYQSLEAKLTKYGEDFNAKPNSSTAIFAQTNSENENNSEAGRYRETKDQVGGTSANDDVKQGKVLLKQKAGTVLYAANKMTVNTDLATKVVFDIMGLPHTHPLFRSTAHGTVELKYDNVVIHYNSICPEFGECYSIDGIAVDPVTKSASINGDINKHYWYRFGGLTLATLAQGAGMAIAESRERTETFDEQGKSITYTGLNGAELLVRAAEPVGEALASVFMENVNRPYTGTIQNGEEVGIFLFEDIELREGVKK